MKKVVIVALALYPFLLSPSVWAKHSHLALRTHLLEDGQGKRQVLANKGIRFDANLISDTAYLISGGRNPGARPESSAHLGLDVDFNMQTLAGWKGVNIHTQITARQGQNTSVRNLQDPMAPELSSVQVAFARGNQGSRLSELSIEKKFDQHGLSIKAGRLNLGGDFDVMSCHFQNSSFCGAQMGKWQSGLWMNTPVAQWGARVKFDIHPELSAQIGVYEFNPDNGNAHAEGQGWSLDSQHADGVTVPVELIWHPQFGSHDLAGTYRAGFMWNTAHDVNNQKNVVTGLAENHSDGEWISIEQQLTTKAGAGSGTQQGLETFENFTWHDQATNKIDNTQQIGLEYVGLSDHHPHDILGLAVNRVHLNPHFVHTQELHGKHQFNARAEYNLELNYNYNLTPWLLLRPDLQYVVHPGSSNNVNNAFVVGLTTKLVF
ncbi:carbohydrate porin [Acinetobacter sp. 187]|uniref:carbohydrate porin n=1 Tax=Acinetobacter lanii TaxID=2715163 RepID=UPI0014093BA1|nr:carbohydrate porin [Acinetobacter lanii]NHC03475.1 carbohydrate porin [Acinetobacter lanii]